MFKFANETTNYLKRSLSDRFFFCAGQKFALLEMKTFLSCLLRNYKLEAVDTPESLILSHDMVLRSKNGIRVKIQSRGEKKHS